MLTKTVVDADGKRDELLESIRLIPGHQLILDGLGESVLECSLKSIVILAALIGEGAKLDRHLSDTMGALTEGQESLGGILTADRMVEDSPHLLREAGV